MNEQPDTSEGVVTLDRHVYGSLASSDPPAGSLWASALGTSPTPARGTVAAGELGDEKSTDEGPEAETLRRVASIGTNARSAAALLDVEASARLRERWSAIQGQFVDEPRSAVQQADTLVSEVIEQITRVFAKEHSSLQSQWKRGEDVSTEDLRQALQHYRSLFKRLVV